MHALSPLRLFTLCLTLLLHTSLTSAGRVNNQTPWTMRYTTDATTSTGPPNLCYFWNWQNASPHDRRVHCTQRNLAPYSSYSSSSLDGFTYADREYQSSGGQGQTRGVWTKLGNQIYQCESSGGSDPFPKCRLVP